MRETLPMPVTRLADVAPLLAVGDTFVNDLRPWLRYTVERLAEIRSWCGWFVQARCIVHTPRSPEPNEGRSFVKVYVANGALLVRGHFGDPIFLQVTVVERAPREPVQLDLFGEAV